MNMDRPIHQDLKTGSINTLINIYWTNKTNLKLNQQTTKILILDQ